MDCMSTVNEISALYNIMNAVNNKILSDYRVEIMISQKIRQIKTQTSLTDDIQSLDSLSMKVIHGCIKSRQFSIIKNKNISDDTNYRDVILSWYYTLNFPVESRNSTTAYHYPKVLLTQLRFMENTCKPEDKGAYIDLMKEVFPRTLEILLETFWNVLKVSDEIKEEIKNVPLKNHKDISVLRMKRFVHYKNVYEIKDIVHHLFENVFIGTCFFDDQLTKNLKKNESNEVVATLLTKFFNVFCSFKHQLKMEQIFLILDRSPLLLNSLPISEIIRICKGFLKVSAEEFLGTIVKCPNLVHLLTSNIHILDIPSTLQEWDIIKQFTFKCLTQYCSEFDTITCSRKLEIMYNKIVATGTILVLNTLNQNNKEFDKKLNEAQTKNIKSWADQMCKLVVDCV
ncbi:hypothetical protein BB558_005741 [Smittium angustum]|uniref:Uncharacterized protein n=1 Tax=Smittium angustum TaxID=133377 RepID=A0A2U1IZM3_SMIAN|nr:hypothetical protein BB558_005741 [Smittium angustum]